MTAAKETPGLFLTHFARLEERLERDGDSWLHKIRKDAIGRFAELGFPTTRLEEWKYTNVAPIARTHFQAAEFRWDGLTDQDLAELPLAHSAREPQARYAAPALSVVDARIEPGVDEIREQVPEHQDR